MNLKVVIAAAVLALWSVSALSDGNRAVIEQVGKNPGADSPQQEDRNIATVIQVDGAQTAFVRRPGDDNPTMADWTTLAPVIQNDNRNLMAIHQNGIGHIAWTSQSGNGNEISLIQKGSHNSASLEQVGDRNLIDTEQYGAGNLLDVSQFGSQLGFKAVQKGGGIAIQVRQTNM